MTSQKVKNYSVLDKEMENQWKRTYVIVIKCY